MIKLADKMFTWAIKRTCVMVCETAAKRDERDGVIPNPELQPVRVNRDTQRRR